MCFLFRELADAVKDLDVANAEAVDYKARYTSLLKRSDQMSADLETARIDLSSLSGTNASLEEMLQQRSSSIEDALEQARSDRKDLEIEINSLREILKDKDVQLNRTKEDTALLQTEKEIASKVHIIGLTSNRRLLYATVQIRFFG